MYYNTHHAQRTRHQPENVCFVSVVHQSLKYKTIYVRIWASRHEDKSCRGYGNEKELSKASTADPLPVALLLLGILWLLQACLAKITPVLKLAIGQLSWVFQSVRQINNCSHSSVFDVSLMWSLRACQVCPFQLLYNFLGLLCIWMHLVKQRLDRQIFKLSHMIYALYDKCFTTRNSQNDV